MNNENIISKDKNLLLVFSGSKQPNDELTYLTENFCGSVLKDATELPKKLSPKYIYACGDIHRLRFDTKEVFIILELSYNYENASEHNHKLISLGEVPIVVHNAGVFFRRLFDEENLFQKINAEHTFQHLTESTKQSMALRKGIYLTEVTKETQDILRYRLLRCSSNLTGPTDNFRETDHKIIDAINAAASCVFEKETKLNHVLAQIYFNKKNTDAKAKETKAKIKAHSDKTKDMPEESLIAFCTFYDDHNFDQLKISKTDRFDWCFKKTSGLTRLHFKLKPTVEDTSLVKEFSITLYPNSVFFIPLSTNRLYTHEIRPSLLNIDRIPTRMGYVARSSKTEAFYIDNQTYIEEDGKRVKLAPMTEETMSNLQDTYYQENKTEEKVTYGKIHFSMNSGDYKKPIY